MMISSYLSIWEIAHRWHNIDPNKTDPQNLSFEIQDTLRFLCLAVLAGKISLNDQAFISIDHKSHTERQRRFFEVQDLPEDIENCATSRNYSKEVLDAYLIDRIELFRWTAIEERAFPDFWMDDSMLIAIGDYSPESSDQSSKAKNMASARTSVIDKSICQAIARTLWDIKPEMRIAEMARHKAIQQYGNGRLYTGKNTLADWLREVAPEHIKNKPGRPKRKASNDAA